MQAFMISSSFGHFKDIVSFTPVKCLTSEQLTPMLIDVLNIVQNAGFIVVVVVSDNNQVNAKTFQAICGSLSFEEGIDNPHHTGHKIFFLYDTVHILKCVRKNWLNQTGSGQTFSYPTLTPQLIETSSLLLIFRLNNTALITFNFEYITLFVNVCGQLNSAVINIV